MHKGIMTKYYYKKLIFSFYICGKIFKNVDIYSIINKILMIESKVVIKKLKKIQLILLFDLDNDDFELFKEISDKIAKAIEDNNIIEITLIKKV